MAISLSTLWLYVSDAKKGSSRMSQKRDVVRAIAWAEKLLRRFPWMADGELLKDGAIKHGRESIIFVRKFWP